MKIFYIDDSVDSKFKTIGIFVIYFSELKTNEV